MIFDSLKNSALYYSLNPRLEKAFGFIARPTGRRWNPVSTTRRQGYLCECHGYRIEEARRRQAGNPQRLSRHSGACPRRARDLRLERTSRPEQTAGRIDAEKDIQLFDDEPQTCYTIRPGQFTILMPEDGHAPMIGEGDVRKIIVKVRR